MQDGSDWPRAICIWGGCEKPGVSRGLCNGHYQSARRTNTLPQMICVIDGCDLDALTRRRRCEEHKTRCVTSGCVRRTSKGDAKCGTHSASRVRAREKARKPEPIVRPRNPRIDGKYVGEWRLDPQGYVIRTEREEGGKSRIVFQHRSVMREHIGRNLVKGENVHHVNGNKADNRIENLELWSTSQPAGQRVEDKIAWAKEIIDMYRDWEDVA